MEPDDSGGGKLTKHEPFKRKHRIKTVTPSDATEPTEIQAQVSITITDTNGQEPQEKRRESVDQNNIQGGPTIEEPNEDNEEENAEEEKEDEEENKPEKPEEAAPKEIQETKTLAPSENNPLPPAKAGPTPRKAPKFKQRASRQFKSKPPKRGILGFGDDIPGMDGLGTDITVICPWEAFSHLELHELAQYGII
ncbi:neuroendocrine secretory protein 55-like [Bufo bufo]|uniref:neuroendocrine secretory protein 55-like n=1 Tax=Bufo bufo TaxID=8384 RepID=UPI001ABEC3C9|nr:neuroendocrine secretory protein 55-like [Bufo bufo]